MIRPGVDSKTRRPGVNLFRWIQRQPGSWSYA